MKTQCKKCGTIHDKTKKEYKKSKWICSTKRSITEQEMDDWDDEVCGFIGYGYPAVTCRGKLKHLTHVEKDAISNNT